MTSPLQIKFMLFVQKKSEL